MLVVGIVGLIPESQAHGNERLATVALLCGFVMMLALERVLG